MIHPRYFLACMFFCYVFQVAVCADENGYAMNLKNIREFTSPLNPTWLVMAFGSLTIFPMETELCDRSESFYIARL